MANTLSISPQFHWIGALDPNLRTFDIIMETEFGTTYNAYLLQTSEGVILFETVKDKFFEDYLTKIQSLCSLNDIRYIVVNHTEPDHAGSVAKLVALAPHITVVGSTLAIKYISEMINGPFKSQIVKDQECLALGDKTLQFISAPNLHWPDTMYTFIQEDGLLITCDSFGAHYCDARIFKSALEPEKEADFIKAYRYYFDMIMGPFKPYVQKGLEKIKDLPLQYICPGHGMILDTATMKACIDLYDEWSTPEVYEKQVVIAYVSAYGYTKALALAIAEGIKTSGYSGAIHLCNLEEVSLEEVMRKIHTAEGLLLGSPTILAEALPPIWNILSGLNPVLHKHLTVGCFGSYGWSGEALVHIQQRLKQLKCPMPLAPLGVIFKPSETDLKEAEKFGADFVKSFI